MELGQLLFGNPRGSFAVTKPWVRPDFMHFLERAGFTERGFIDDTPKGQRLVPLLTECTNGYGLENNVFMIRPYDWDPQCTCGFDERFEEWLAGQSGHAPDCYQTVLKARKQAVVAEYGVAELHQITPQARYNEAYDRYSKLDYALAAERGLPEAGCAVHCTCPFEKAQAEFLGSDDHKPDCRWIQPNFRHKPTGFELNWYKYPLRDASTNVQIKRTQFLTVLADCLKSLGIDPDADE